VHVLMLTGFMTAKGELVRSILFPKPVDFKFTQDSLKFIGCLALIALIGMIYTVVLMVCSEVKTGSKITLLQFFRILLA
jgi:cation-transporting ATPase 13A2